jgi:translocation and assembly module TamB
MVSPSPLDDQDSPLPRRSHRVRWALGLLAGSVGLLVVASVLVGPYLERSLRQRAEQELTKALQYPAKLGPIQGLSWDGLTLGPTVLYSDQVRGDRLRIESARIQLDWGKTLRTRQPNLSLTLLNPQLTLTQDADGQWLSLPKFPDRPGDNELDVSIQHGRVTLIPRDRQGQLQKPLEFEGINGRLAYRGSRRPGEIDLSTQLVSGGRVRAQGAFTANGRLGQIRFDVTSLQLQPLTGMVTAVIPTAPEILAGKASGAFILRLEDRRPPQLFGDLVLQQGAFRAEGLPQPLRDLQALLTFRGTTMDVRSLQGRFGDLQARGAGKINFQNGFDLQLAIAPAAAPIWMKALPPQAAEAHLKGVLTAQLQLQGAFERPILSGVVQSVGPLSLHNIPLERIQGRFRFDGQQLQIPALIAQVAGGRVQAQGRLSLHGRQTLQANVQAQGIEGTRLAGLFGVQPQLKLGQLSAVAQVSGSLQQPQAIASWQLASGQIPGQGQLIWRGNSGQVVADLGFQGGRLQADARLQGDRWQGAIQLAQVPLEALTSEVQGRVSGSIQAQGRLSQMTAAGTQLASQLRVGSDLRLRGQPLVKGPLEADWRWDGRNLAIARLAGQGLRAQGTISTRTTGKGLPQPDQLALQVEVQELNLAALPLLQGLGVEGRVSFQGQVLGSPGRPLARGQLQVAGLAANGLRFHPQLRGPLRYGPQGASLDLNGGGDRLAVALDARWQPQSLLLQQGSGRLVGQRDAQDFLLTAQNWDLAAIQIPGPPGAISLPLGGRLHAQARINLTQGQGRGELQVDRPQFGYLLGDRLVGQFQIANNALTLSQTRLSIGQGSYSLEGRLGLTPDLPWQLALEIDQANPQSAVWLLRGLQLSQDPRSTELLSPERVASLNLPALETATLTGLQQLQKWAQAEAITQARAASTSPWSLPPLRDFQGRFNGRLQLRGRRQQLDQGSLELQGRDLAWGIYQLDRLTLQAKLVESELVIEPLLLETGASRLQFQGRISNQAQSGQLSVSNLPLEYLRQFFKLPVQLGGNVNLNATLAGRFDAPQAVGEIFLEDGSLNGQPIQTEQSGFAYNSGRLTFGIALREPDVDPIRLTGSLPLPLPFAGQPADNGIRLNLQIRETGLALLEPLTQGQARWLGGQGEVNLRIVGTLQSPQMEGFARFQDAHLAIQAIAEPITAINGEVLFSGDRLRVDQLDARFSRGAIRIRGALPVVNASTEATLTIALNNLKLNLPNLYEGNANADLRLQGSMLRPRLGGQINLDQGRILAVNPGAEGPPIPKPNGSGDNPLGLQLNNLKVVAGQRLAVTSPGLFDFRVQGDLTLNGPPNLGARPSGTLQLTRGRVNLFTTNFTLNRRQTNVVVFRPSLGFDPFVQMNLLTLMPEYTGTRISTTGGLKTASSFSYVNPAAFGQFQLVRIDASVSSLASELIRNIELTSNPSRSEQELIALIGGGFIAGLANNPSSSGELAIAGLASRAVLNNVQNWISDALGDSLTFQIFPALILNRKQVADSGANTNNSTLALSAQIGYDITPRLNLSLLQTLTLSQPTQFNIQYQISNRWNFRSYFDFAGNSFFIVEYQKRF